MEKHLYFVRHGESNSNVDGILRGTDAVLTEKGEREAQFIAERMKSITVDALISSTYTRALQTAAPIREALGLPVEESDLFVERRSPSALRNREVDDTFTRENDEFQERYCEAGYVHSDEETLPEIAARAFAALRFLEEHPAKRICVVTHGIFLRALFCAVYHEREFGGDEFRDTWQLASHNTGLTYIRRLSEGYGWEQKLHIVSWNDLAHLG